MFCLNATRVNANTHESNVLVILGDDFWLQKKWPIIFALLRCRKGLYDKNGECVSFEITDDAYDVALVIKNIMFSMFLHKNDRLNGFSWDNITMADLGCDGGRRNNFCSLELIWNLNCSLCKELLSAVQKNTWLNAWPFFLLSWILFLSI